MTYDEEVMEVSNMVDDGLWWSIREIADTFDESHAWTLGRVLAAERKGWLRIMRGRPYRVAGVGTPIPSSRIGNAGSWHPS